MERRRLQEPPPPLRLFEALRERGDAFLLQSADGPRRLARFSMIGFDPESWVTVENGEALVDGQARPGRPQEALASIAGAHRSTDDEGYAYNGGLVGHLNYEYASLLEDLPRPEASPGAPQGFPEVQMGLFLDGVIYDHERRSCFYFTQSHDRSGELPLAEARERRTREAAFKVDALTTTHDEHAFGEMVERAKRYIADGHIFQVVLSRAFQGDMEGSPVDAYEQLLAINPSPYMFFFSFQGRDLFGASPEMLVRVEDDKVETDPIAGTRPLGETPRRTQELEAELLASAKERAEHAMLVDLARNDIGRVATSGTVEVEDLMRVERYSHVQHLVSRVGGRLAPGKNAFDALDAVFPAGTVSGAPKVRAMEIIAELEDVARGPYAGCVGYLSLNGNLDTAITIRSAWAARGRIELRTGAGIVAESTPEGEFRETQDKGDAMLDALSGRGGWTA